MTQPAGKNLWTALAKARKALKGFERKASYQFGKYVSAEDAIAAARQVLSDNDLEIWIEDVSYIPDTVGNAPQGGGARGGEGGFDACRIRMSVVLIHVPSQEHLRLYRELRYYCPIGHNGSRTGLAAWTSLISYILRDMLFVPRKEPYELERIGAKKHETPEPVVTAQRVSIPRPPEPPRGAKLPPRRPEPPPPAPPAPPPAPRRPPESEIASDDINGAMIRIATRLSKICMGLAMDEKAEICRKAAEVAGADPEDKSDAPVWVDDLGTLRFNRTAVIKHRKELLKWVSSLDSTAPA